MSEYVVSELCDADPGGFAIFVVGLWPLACCGCGFESRLGRGYLSCGCCILSCVGICDEPIPRPEETNRVYAIECD